MKADFQAMAKDGCKQCHADPSGNEIPRKYYVDQSMMDQVNKLGQALAAPAPDQKTIGELVGFSGNESCVKCYFVHLPAQTAKDTWNRFADVLK
ncbi:MAG: hypothetical protein Q7R57_01915 [Dehalococcoidales bacterium]|nr:hypothetical protein [Dehalococcoidales bacterium]